MSMKLTIKNKPASFLLLLFSAVLLQACPDQMPEPQPITSPSTATSRIQMFNFAPDLGEVNVMIDNAPSNFPALSYQAMNNVANNYMQVQAGTRQIRVTGGGLSNSLVLQQQFPTNSVTTIFITDTLNRPGSGTAPGGPRTLVVNDNLQAFQNDSSRVRFLHLAPTRDSLGVFNTVTDSFLFRARTFRQLTSGSGANQQNFANFTQLRSGSYTLDIRSPNSASPAIGPIVAIFEPGKYYTIVARGRPDGEGDQALGYTIIQHN